MKPRPSHGGVGHAGLLLLVDAAAGVGLARRGSPSGSAGSQLGVPLLEGVFVEQLLKALASRGRRSGGGTGTDLCRRSSRFSTSFLKTVALHCGHFIHSPSGTPRLASGDGGDRVCGYVRVCGNGSRLSLGGLAFQGDSLRTRGRSGGRPHTRPTRHLSSICASDCELSCPRRTPGTPRHRSRRGSSSPVEPELLDGLSRLAAADHRHAAAGRPSPRPRTWCRRANAGCSNQPTGPFQMTVFGGLDAPRLNIARTVFRADVHALVTGRDRCPRRPWSSVQVVGHSHAMEVHRQRDLATDSTAAAARAAVDLPRRRRGSLPMSMPWALRNV